MPSCHNYLSNKRLEAVAKPGRAACPHAAAAGWRQPARIREVLQLPRLIYANLPTSLSFAAKQTSLYYSGAVVFGIESANVVGYVDHLKTNGVKYEPYGCPIITPGAAGTTFRLYDMKVVGTLTTATKKSNFIQLFQPSTLKLDLVRSYYWDPTKTSTVTGETGCWCYKNNDETTGQVRDAEVPHDTSFPAGTAFLFNCPTDNKGVGLQFAGQVIQPTPDEDGYITISKVIGGSEVKYMFFANPFPTNISLADMKIAGTLTTATKKSNFIQKFQTATQKLDLVNAYYWDYAKTSAVTGKTGCWCYKNNDETTGQMRDAEVLDAAEISIAPGAGFFFNSPTTAKEICIKIKVPAAIAALSSND